MIARVVDRFLHYYHAMGAEVLPGASLVDPAIPQNFVMSAGLAHFEGSPYDQSSKGIRQCVLCQNCFRYFDLEHMERSDYHLSLFKMLGAFSFGSIERESAISQLWELLVNDYGVDASHLWATYFGGGKVNECDIPVDADTRSAWIKVGVKPERVVGLDARHSFWKQGRATVGDQHAPKCGEHTEVYFDRGEVYKCGLMCGPGCSCGRFVEFAGILFITYHMGDLPGELTTLPLPFSETVVGVERLAMLLGNMSSVFDIEDLYPLIDLVRTSTKKLEDVSFVDPKTSQQVITDHLRAILFLAADGAPPPGKGGRKRLMRKLIRRTLTHMQLLGISWDSSFLPLFFDLLVGLCDEPLSYLSRGRTRALEFFAQEQCRFEETLAATEHSIDCIAKEHKMPIDGYQILDLVKKRGMPLPLVRAYCNQKGIVLNEQEYWAAHKSWQEELI